MSISRQQISEKKIIEALSRCDQVYSPPMPRDKPLRRAAVLVPFVCLDDEWHLLFTRRTETVDSHKGQVAFPGGAIDPGDVDAVAAALREAEEEIGLKPSQVRILGKMPEYPTITEYLVTPVVGRVTAPLKYRLSPAEVERAFTIPLDWLRDPAHWQENPLVFPDGRRDRVIYYQLYDDELLWGITARITVNLLKILGLMGKDDGKCNSGDVPPLLV